MDLECLESIPVYSDLIPLQWSVNQALYIELRLTAYCQLSKYWVCIGWWVEKRREIVVKLRLLDTLGQLTLTDSPPSTLHSCCPIGEPNKLSIIWNRLERELIDEWWDNDRDRVQSIKFRYTYIWPYIYVYGPYLFFHNSSACWGFFEFRYENAMPATHMSIHFSPSCNNNS